jgi:hypothetical protein
MFQASAMHISNRQPQPGRPLSPWGKSGVWQILRTSCHLSTTEAVVPNFNAHLPALIHSKQVYSPYHFFPPPKNKPQQTFFRSRRSHVVHVIWLLRNIAGFTTDGPLSLNHNIPSAKSYMAKRNTGVSLRKYSLYTFVRRPIPKPPSQVSGTRRMQP